MYHMFSSSDIMGSEKIIESEKKYRRHSEVLEIVKEYKEKM